MPSGNSPFLDKEAFQLFPNPTRGMTTLDYPANLAEENSLNLAIVGIDGSVIKNIVLDQSGEIILSTNVLNPGIYMLSIKSDKKIFWREKLVVLR